MWSAEECHRRHRRQPTDNINKSWSNGRVGLISYLLPTTVRGMTTEEQLPNASDLANSTLSSANLRFGFDGAFDCAGWPSCVRLGNFTPLPGSKLVLVGMGSFVQTLPQPRQHSEKWILSAGFSTPVVTLYLSNYLLIESERALAEIIVTHTARFRIESLSGFMPDKHVATKITGEQRSRHDSCHKQLAYSSSSSAGCISAISWHSIWRFRQAVRRLEPGLCKVLLFLKYASPMIENPGLF